MLTRSGTVKRWMIAACALLSLAACTADSRDPVPTKRAAARLATPMRARTGVDQLPDVRDNDAFNRALLRRFPEQMRRARKGGSVLVDVSVDERGTVRDVALIPRSRDTAVRLVLVDRATGQRTEQPVDRENDPIFAPAVQAALRETRFTPATRDGRAVPFTLRMTILVPEPARAS